MGVFSRKLGVWARCAAVASAIFALIPAADAATKGSKPAAPAHRAAGKRAAVVVKPAPGRARATKSAGTVKASVKDADAKRDVDAKDAKDAKRDVDAKDAKPGKNAKDAAKSEAKNAAKSEAKSEPNVAASSVGSPNEGKLVGGVKLGTADGTVRVVPAYQRGDTRWGLPALVKMLERSAKKVAKKHPGAVLGVGDISRKNGGDIFLHRSHESGRDADIAFYVTDVRGRNFLPDTFVRFEGSVESASHQGVRFDVAKNWALVQAWLEDPTARVSHIFVADPLRRMLLAHAKPRVSPALYNRAALAMMQPSNALPHDNHFHVRISCPAAMKKSCVEFPAGALAKNTKDTKKAKGKPALVTPKGKQGTTAAQAQAVAARKPKATAAKPAAQARIQAPRRPRNLGVAPRAVEPERKLADFERPPRKPTYLQSAVANDDTDPLDRVLFSVPALSHLGGADTDGDADGQDVKASVDDSGTVKITD